MSNLVGRKPVEVSIRDLVGNSVPQWDAQNKCWKNTVIDSRIKAPYPLEFDFSNVSTNQSKYIKIFNDCRIEYEIPGEAYCETSPSQTIEFELHSQSSGGNFVKFGSVSFDNTSNFGVFSFEEPEKELISFAIETDDVIKVTSPSNLYGAQNIRISVFGIVILPVGRADPKIIIDEDELITTFSTTYHTSSDLNSPVSSNQTFILRALNLGESSDNVIITSTGGNFEFATDPNNTFSSTIGIPHQGDIADPVTIYCRVKKGAFTIDDDYYLENNISTQVTKSFQDVIEISHENVINPITINVDFNVIIPPIVKDDSLVLLIDTGDSNSFTIYGAGSVSNTSGSIIYAKKDFPFNTDSNVFPIYSNQKTIVPVPSPGIYIVQLSEGIKGIKGYEEEDYQIIDVLRFGNLPLGDGKEYRTDLSGFFRNCAGITSFTASTHNDYPSFSLDTNTKEFFHNAINFNDPYINEWDFSNVIEISGFFKGASLFNQKVDKWQFGESIISDQNNGVFLDSGIDQLNADLSFIGWANYAISVNRNFLEQDFDVGISSTGNNKLPSQCETYGLENPILNGTFALAELGNRNLIIFSSNINQDIRLAENGVTVLAGSADYGQENVINGITYVVRDRITRGDTDPISPTNASTSVTSKITDMSNLFSGDTLGDSSSAVSIIHFDTSNVTDMSGMFQNAIFGSAYNESLAIWDVSNVTNFDNMFNGSSDFNTDLTYWDVSNVSEPTDFIANSDLQSSFVPNWGDVYQPLPLTNKKAKVAYSLRYVAPYYVGKPVVEVKSESVVKDLTMYDIVSQTIPSEFNVTLEPIRISKLYDQSLNNIDFIEENESGPVIAKRPSGGGNYEFILEKDKVALEFNGISNYLASDNNLYLPSLSMFFVLSTKENPSTTNHTFLYLSNLSNFAQQFMKLGNLSGFYNRLSSYTDFGTVSNYSSSEYIGNFLFASTFENGVFRNSYVDTIDINTTSNTSLSILKGDYTKSSIGVEYKATQEGTKTRSYFSGKIQEIIIIDEFLSDTSDDFSDIESSINSYYVLSDISQFINKVLNAGGKLYFSNLDVENEHHANVYQEVTTDLGTLPFVLCPCNAGKQGILYNINPT